MLVQAAWGAVQVRGRLQARYRRLVRRFGGDKNPGAKKKAITAIVILSAAIGRVADLRGRVGNTDLDAAVVAPWSPAAAA
jgi:hypothetical protein